MSSCAEETLNKIKDRTATVAICGLGYVGLPLVDTFLKNGFTVLGLDIDSKKINALQKGKSYIAHFNFDTLKTAYDAKKFLPTNNFEELKRADAILIAVPTPLTPQREPDLVAVESTFKQIAKTLRAGQLIVLESTTYPGTTDEVCFPILKPFADKAGLTLDEDFFMAYSPEREDPGNKNFSTRTIPKVVGGFGENAKTLAVALYQSVVDKVIPVTSTREAELCKIFENTFRAVNIALVNELKMLCLKMNIDPWEVIDAAATKPFGFMPFYPGPGLGGHCIPIDPFYLTWKAREYDLSTRFIELAGEVNTRMPYQVIDRLVFELSQRGKGIKGANLLVLGVAYKKNIDDDRESPGLKIIFELQKLGARVDYNDPYVKKTHTSRHYDIALESRDLNIDLLRSRDAVLVVTDHDVYDWGMIAEHSALILDSRNALKGIAKRDNIIRV